MGLPGVGLCGCVASSRPCLSREFLLGLDPVVDAELSEQVEFLFLFCFSWLNFFCISFNFISFSILCGVRHCFCDTTIYLFTIYYLHC